MFPANDVMGMASALAAHSEARLDAYAQNVANADTPGYRAKDLAPFTETYRSGPDLTLLQTRAGHLGDGDANPALRPAPRGLGHMSPNGNDDSLEDETMRAAVARQDHDMALTIYKSALNILRTSIGRR